MHAHDTASAARRAVFTRRAVWLALALLVGAAGAQATTDLTLEGVLARLPASPQWQQADLSLQVAQRNLEAARAATGLTLGLGGGLTATTDFGNAGSGTTLTPTVNLVAGLNTLPWSSAQSTIRAAERNLIAARAQQSETRANLALSAAQQYFAARLATFDVTLAQRTLELRQRQLAAATARRGLGNASSETVLSSTADVQTAQTNVLSAQQTLRQNLAALSTTLGVLLTNVTFASAPQDPGAPGDVNALIALAEANRATVVAAAQNLVAAQDSLSVAQRDRRLPALTASVSYGNTLTGSLNFKTGATSTSFAPALTDAALASAGAGRANALALGVSATYNFLDPVADAQIASAQTQLSAANVALGLARDAVELDVRQRYATLASARAALSPNQTLIDAVQTTLNTVRAQFAAGSVTQTDVLSAEVNLLSAQRNLESALESAQLAAYALRNAQGLIAPGVTP